jgi:glyoxylase-like metal-dependent hydrolase (beta-lactamase superfamily II)/8-oxo-dGTP pyrophosphatase MutT (NUDIX family)
MSEPNLYLDALARLQEMFPAPPPQPIRPSASVIPWRTNRAGETEVFWVRRSLQLGVLGGWYAFPGGGVSKTDASLPISAPPFLHADLTTAFPTYDIIDIEDDITPGVVGCLIRELFEETGLLLSEEKTSSQLTKTQLEEARTAILRKSIRFEDWLRERGMSLDASRLVFAGRWMTPPISPMRFDTRFFLLHWPESESIQPDIDRGELVEGEWIEPTEAIRRWREEHVLAAPPTLYFLEVLSESSALEAPSRLVPHGNHSIHAMKRFLETRPGIIAIPLLTPTLPPARETISYLVGKEKVVLVDVGSPFPSEIERLGLLLDFLEREFGKKLEAIWLTHHHPDHVWGVELFRKTFDVPVMAHPDTAERLARQGMRVDGFLQDGDEFNLGGDPEYRVRLIHTPGHAKGHLAIWEETHRTLIAGDLVAGHSTIMIDPPDGDMDEYLSSLERVKALNPRTLFPSHGPAITEAVSRLEILIHHRLEREEKIRGHWEAGIRSIAELTAKVYVDVSSQLIPFAERQVEAHLIRLERQGLIQK